MKRPENLRAARFVLPVLFVWSAGAAAYAQYVVGAKAGIVQCAQGEVSLDDRPIALSRGSFPQVHPGQTLRTGLGYVELILGPDVYLRLGIFGRLRMEQNRLDDTRLVLEEGSSLIEIVQENKWTRTRVRLPGGEAEIRKKGLYRLDAGSGQVRVYGGSALVSGAGKKATVKSGREVSVVGDLSVRRFSAREGDSLHQWAARRSFDIYQTLLSPRVQSHWQQLSLGWAVNSNYRIRFFSEKLLREWRLHQHVPLEVKIAAELERKRIQAAQEYMEQQAIAARKELEASRYPGGKLPQ